jgi:hypothetical protein
MEFDEEEEGGGGGGRLIKSMTAGVRDGLSFFSSAPLPLPLRFASLGSGGSGTGCDGGEDGTALIRCGLGGIGGGIDFEKRLSGGGVDDIAAAITSAGIDDARTRSSHSYDGVAICKEKKQKNMRKRTRNEREKKNYKQRLSSPCVL